MARAFEIDLRWQAAGCTAEVTAGIVLAAGASTRMGTPKAMLPFRGGTFLSCLCERLSLHCSPVIAVVGAHADRIVHPVDAELVVNKQWSLGQLSSLQCGLRALPGGVGRVLFTLVDHPDPDAVTVARLCASEALVAVPVHAGRKGHPVCFSQGLVLELLGLAPSGSAKDVFRRYVADTEFVSVTDPGVVDDVDDPEALASFRIRTGVV